VNTFAVVHDRHTPQQACAAGVTSGMRFNTGSALVFVRSSTPEVYEGWRPGYATRAGGTPGAHDPASRRRAGPLRRPGVFGPLL